uniref:NADH-ubiquinone oxidoreductase chain 4 n=1 Tax=Homidia socia TaxID=301514 RepID=A0A6G6A4M7_9HEXA|nr:NADH dehydrogenase subunit 4 [Homidia socia]
MMKILFLLTSALLIIPLSNFYFWLMGTFLLFSVIFFFMKNFILVDYVFCTSSFLNDSLTYSLVILSLWISALMLYSSYNIFSSNLNIVSFVFFVFVLCLILVLTFNSLNLLNFYFYFEVSLIPTLLIIFSWGYQPERLQAGIYFLFYTMTASLPLLIVLIYIFWVFGNLDFIMFYQVTFFYSSFFLFLSLTLAFLVKMPMFFVHLWLPKAHVEAPVSGSMILAGILLKLGGYGFYRILSLCLSSVLVFGSYIFGLSILGMMYVGFMCCRLNDLKALVAYSSVAHMALVICGVFSVTFWGFSGSLLMMLSHGLVSSGMFCVVNMFYERSSSRSLFMNKGLLTIFPACSLFIFLLLVANMAAPPSLNLMSEIFLMVSILKYDNLMLLFFPLGSYMGAVFTIFMFSFSQHGKTYFSNYSYMKFTFREFHILFIHIFPVNILILKSYYFFVLF